MPKTVLIADDDRELLDAIALRCRRLGLRVFCAHDAFTALSLVKSEMPDMVCLDVEMPAGNGLSVCEMLTSDEACRSIPVAIMTGRTDPDTIIRCHNMCAYYIEKCPDVWTRLEPLLIEILGLPNESGESACRPQFHACG
ncbi:MAG TPA: response regulator [Planctomycetaceae bacterium]|jgi:DNA-binding response OmpR family regulator|nr:response regulator [Planctomycetaceae bacterium]